MLKLKCHLFTNTCCKEPRVRVNVTGFDKYTLPFTWQDTVCFVFYWLNWSELLLMRHSGQISVFICYFFYPLVFMAFSPTFKALIRTGFWQESWIFWHENGHTSPHYILYIVGLGHFLCNLKPVAAVRLEERKIHPFTTGFSSSVRFDSFSSDFHQIVLLTASKCIHSGLW